MPYRFLRKLGDRVEDRVRGTLSHYPIFYAFLGGMGTVVFWRGIWHGMDFLTHVGSSVGTGTPISEVDWTLWWDGPLSLLLGAAMLVTCGLFVSNFIGNEILISGLKREKKLMEKTEQEVSAELDEEKAIRREIHEIDKRLKRMESALQKKK